MVDEIKRCSKCRAFKTLPEFCKHRSHKDGLNTRCRMCENKRVKTYDLEHKEHKAVYNVWVHISEHTVNGRYEKNGRKNPKNARYFAAGTRIHGAWQDDSAAFVKWVRENIGERPKDEDGDWMSIDRIDNDGHYEPGNLRWADWETQNKNKGRAGHMKDAGYIEGYYGGTESF